MGEVFVANFYSNTVTVISDATNAVIANILVGSYPNGVAYDSGKGEVFVANYASNTVSVISDATNAIVASIPVGSNPYGVAYDSGMGEVFVTNSYSDNVSVISDATNAVVATIPVGSYSKPIAVAYDSGTGEVFLTNTNSPTVTVISDATNAVVATIPVGSSPNGAAYDAGSGYTYVANSLQGTISIISTGHYPVSYTETGLPTGTSWSVTLNGTTHASTTNTITFSEANGTYAYTVGSVADYMASPASGSVTVSGARVSRSITFTAVPPARYDVSFTETGLPTGTSWSVTLRGTTLTSTMSTITFSEANGTYAYTIGAIPGYSTPSYAGSIVVLGTGVTHAVPWGQVTYAVTFEESGLPPGTSWSVSVGGTTQPSTTTTDVFNEPNGLYSYTVSAVTGYTPLPSSGTITVNGASVTQAIAFSAVPSGPTIGSFSASPSTVILGSSVTLAVAATGGTEPLTYAYAGLPSGCASANVSVITCTPTATGSFTVTVTVSDAAGKSTTATVSLTVNSQSNPGGRDTILGLPALEGYGLIAGLVIALLVAGTVVVLPSRRKRLRQHPQQPSPPR